MEKLKEDIIKTIGKKRHALAAAMGKASAWHLKNNVITLDFTSPFESSLLKRESGNIEEIIQRELHYAISFKIHLERQTKKDSPVLDEQIEMIKDVFRGTII